MQASLGHQDRKSFGWKVAAFLGGIICFGILLLSLATPAIAGVIKAPQGTESSKQGDRSAICRRGLGHTAQLGTSLGRTGIT
jgi:hypothetical protein